MLKPNGTRLSMVFPRVLLQISGQVSTDIKEFCEMDSTLDVSPLDQWALVNRGGCEFVKKAINAQMSGYKGVIILDTQNETKFSRLIASADNAVPASFVRIPVIFLLSPQSNVIRRERGSQATLAFFLQEDPVLHLSEFLDAPPTEHDRGAELMEVPGVPVDGAHLSGTTLFHIPAGFFR